MNSTVLTFLNMEAERVLKRPLTKKELELIELYRGNKFIYLQTEYLAKLKKTTDNVIEEIRRGDL